MSLILIPGSSGSGKSHMLFERVLREAQEHPRRRYIVLVPEQNTLQTQKELVAMSERGGIWNIDVLSFTRLAYRVFEQTGVARRQVLSETGKVLLLRLIAAREGDRIPLLRGILDRPGTLSEMKSILSEMDQYGIGSDELHRMKQAVQRSGRHPALLRKLSEIGLLQEAFGRYQEGHFITGEKLPRVLSEKALLDETLKGCVLSLDGFTGLTPPQLEVIRVLLGIARDIYVTVTIDPQQLPVGIQDGMCDLDEGKVRRLLDMDPEDYDLFALPKRTIQALLRCAEKAKVPVRSLVVPEGSPGRHREGGELRHLERHLLRAGSDGMVPFHPKEGCGGGHEIFLRQCEDPWDEAVSAAVTIEELVREGVRYREIAIVCGSLADYAEYVRRAMSVYGIPCYIDRSSTVVMNPAFEFVRCAIDILEKNYSYESVMALMRTGLALDPEDGALDCLENYLLAAGIRGQRMWSEPFARTTRNRDPVLLQTAEKLRSAFMERFLPFAKVMKKKRAGFSEYAEAVWMLLVAFDMPDRLSRLSAQCSEEGREDRSQEYASVLEVISGVLDEAALLMGAESVTRTQFAQILQAGFSEAKIGILPRMQDQVQVADLERSRLERVSVVLFLGMNDGFVPRRKAAGGVLTDMEREYLRGQKVRLAPTAREEASIQQYYLYLTLTKPSRSLYLSWSCATRTAQQLRPSGILKNIRTMFPEAAWADAASASPFDSVTSLPTARRVLARALGDYLYADRMAAGWDEPRLKELVNLFRRRQTDGDGQTERALRSLSEAERLPRLDEETAQTLYGMVLHGSITRLETFSECAFRHFASYGLGLKERETFAVRTLEIGSLLHAAVEIFSGKLKGGDASLTWHTVTDGQRDALVLESLEQALERQNGRELFADSARTRQTLARCRRILLRSVKTLQRQILAGSFEPAYFELSFGDGDPDSVWIDSLPGGRRMQLKGKIDRVDECVDEEGKRLYIRVVDYKSSTQDIDLDSLIDGEQLQLLVYLDAAARLEQKANPDMEVVCAGAFYFSFDDPIAEVSSQMTEEQIEDEIVGSMRMKGLMNGRPDAALRQDRQLGSPGPSLVVPAVRNKTTGWLRDSEHILSGEQFDLLQHYARDRMRRTASSILEGEIAPNPVRKDSRTKACNLCPYSDVCRFDPHAGNMAWRDKVRRSSQERWEIITEAVSAAQAVQDPAARQE